MPRVTTIKAILPSAVDIDDVWVRFDPQNQRLVKSKVQWVHVDMDGNWTACGGVERSKPWDQVNRPGCPMQVDTTFFHPESFAMVAETAPSGRVVYGWADDVVTKSKADLAPGPVPPPAPPPRGDSGGPLEVDEAPAPAPAQAAPAPAALPEVDARRARPRTRERAARATEVAPPAE